MPRIYTLQEVAETLNRPYGTIRRWKHYNRFRARRPTTDERQTLLNDERLDRNRQDVWVVDQSEVMKLRLNLPRMGRPRK